MKVPFRLLPAMAAILLLLSGCSKPPPPAPVVVSTPTPGPVVVATPTPKPVAVSTPAATPIAKASATPDDLFYLTQNVSCSSSDGITSFPPGTMVKRTGIDGAMIKVVTADGSALEVQPAQITQDRATAAYYSQADANARRQFGAAQAAAAAAQASQAAAAATATPIPQLAPPAAAPPLGSSLDQGAYGQMTEMASPTHSTKEKKRR